MVIDTPSLRPSSFIACYQYCRTRHCANGRLQWPAAAKTRQTSMSCMQLSKGEVQRGGGTALRQLQNSQRAMRDVMQLILRAKRT